MRKGEGGEEKEDKRGGMRGKEKRKEAE